VSQFIDDFISKNKPQFKKYASYISKNDWTELTIESILNDEYFNELYSEDKNKVKKAEATKLFSEFIKKQKDTVKGKADEYNLQNDLVQYILNRVSVFIKKTQGEHNDPKLKRFVKFCLDVVKEHTDRIEKYLYSIDITKIENQEVRSEEIKLTKDCHKGANEIEEKITNLNIREDQATEGIRWLDDQKATIAMHETLVTQFPEIKIKLDKMGIDFISPPPQTLHILNENPPQYNSDKNYWEQEPETLQYYVNEYKKIERGVEIDGYFIDGWLYFHFNYFPINKPTTFEINGIKENKDIVQIPDLRDNEILITDYFIKSKKDQTMSLIAATRRAAKTTLNSSRIARAQVLNKKQILCAGGSSEDLNHIHNNLDVFYNNVHPAFKLYYLAPTEDGRGKAYGIKTKVNKSKITTNVFIINLEGGTKKSKQESLAGFTPDEFILDEAMKFAFKKNLLALESALWGDGILRCSVLITGTGGSDDLAVDAIKMLNNPSDNKVTLMDWDALERGVPQDLITWKRKKYGLFLPTQMCIKHKKIKSNLASYLGIESETLSKVPLWVTDWEAAKKAEEKERQDKVGDREEYIRLLAYHPFDPEEIFLSGKISPFSDVVDDARRHRDYLLETGKWDNRKNIYRDSDGKITVEKSNEELIPFPFSGRNKDAPYLIIEPPDLEKTPRYYYIASADFYKQEGADSTDSIGVISVFKFPLVGDKSGGKLVATYAARPNRYKEFSEKTLLLLEYYNAVLFPENEDLGVFQTFLEQRHLEDQYLEKHIDFTGTLAYSENSARKYGWTARQSKQKLISIFRKYLEEEVTILNDFEKEVTVKRVSTIDDIHLLSEIIAFSENGNYDRVSSCLGGVGLLHFLDKNYIYPKTTFGRKKEQEEQQPQQKPIRKLQHFTNNPRRNNFTTRRR